MRKLIISMHVSLDGFAAVPGGDLGWAVVNEPIFETIAQLTKNADTAVYGRKTWEIMEAYWPGAWQKENASKHDKEHSGWYNRVEHIVISNSMKGESGNTKFIGSPDAAGFIRALKSGPGKDILMLGSPTAAHLLMKEGLIDEYFMFVNAVLLGSGTSAFGGINEKRELKLKNVKKYPGDVTGMSYEKR